MNFNHQISLFIELTLLLSSTTFASDDYVSIKVHNYTTRSQMADGGCTEDIDIYLKTICGSASDITNGKSSDSCDSILNYEYVYTEDECDTSDSFEFIWYANNDCDGNFAAWIIGSCNNDYQWASTGSIDIADDQFTCGIWNGPYIQSGSSSGDQVVYSLYKPCVTTEAPTPSPTVHSSSLTFTICVDAKYSPDSTTNDADKIQVRLWTDDELYYPTEWRYLTSDSTLFNSSGTCHTFHTFNDISAQWYIMDFSICSIDSIGITAIMYWDMDSLSQQMVSSFDGDSQCIENNGDLIILSGDKYLTCQRLSVNLSYYRFGLQTANEADVEDESETTIFDEGSSDNCTTISSSSSFSFSF